MEKQIGKWVDSLIFLRYSDGYIVTFLPFIMEIL